jgi:hypothetical protein
MRHEIVGPEMAITTGQLRLPREEAITRHIAQYGTWSDLEREARYLTINDIVTSLEIKEDDVPFHNRDEVNLTLMMIWDKRKDLAKQLWTDPEKFKNDHADLFTLGVQRIEVMLKNQENWTCGKEIIKKWKSALDIGEETNC